MFVCTIGAATAAAATTVHDYAPVPVDKAKAKFVCVIGARGLLRCAVVILFIALRS